MKTKIAKFHELPLTTITPEGWLRLFLENQRNGLTGHLDELSYPFNTCCWAGEKVGVPKGLPHVGDWWTYEQSGYWFDGMIRCGYLLRDDFLIKKAKKQIEYVLTHAAENGYLGPSHIISNLWPHAVFFRAMMAEYSATGDKRILEALQKHYLSITPERLVGGSMWRNICNIEEICWLYGLTGDKQLLNHAVKAYELFCAKDLSVTPDNLLSDTKSNDHGGWYCEMVKLPVILYMYTGETRLLEAAINGFRKIDRDHMLIDGIPSSNEALSGKAPRSCHETCVISDFSWSAGYMLLATGEAEWGDKIERACFNAGIGAVTKDFKAHQYFSSPNQIVATRNSSYSDFGKMRMAYRPGHDTQCCTGNVNRFMPNYVSRMWLSDGSGGLVAALYGPSSVNAKVGKDAKEVIIVENTDYPFSETIEFQIRTEKKVRFPLWLRIPGWCRQAAVSLNGRPMELEIKPGSFVKLNREFSHNDRVELSLPMPLKLSYCPRGGVGIERGPLVYSLLIEEDRQVDLDEPKSDEEFEVAIAISELTGNKNVSQHLPTSNEEFPAWNMLPSNPWNYALVIDEKQLEKDVEVIHNPMTPNPWNIDDVPAPIQLRVPARRVKKWALFGVSRYPYYNRGPDKEYVLQTPYLPDSGKLEYHLDEKVEKVTLVPYGCTHLRLSIFPHCQKK